MTTDHSPSLDAIREAAEKASSKNWRVDPLPTHSNVVIPADGVGEWVGVAGHRLDLAPVFTGQISNRDRSEWEADATYIAMMDPQTTLGLVERLEAAERENDELWADLTKAIEVRNLALEEAALEIQPGPDGQDTLDRTRMAHRWIEAAYERHAEGERCEAQVAAAQFAAYRAFTEANPTPGEDD